MSKAQQRLQSAYIQGKQDALKGVPQRPRDKREKSAYRRGYTQGREILHARAQNDARLLEQMTNRNMFVESFDDNDDPFGVTYEAPNDNDGYGTPAEVNVEQDNADENPPKKLALHGYSGCFANKDKAPDA